MAEVEYATFQSHRLPTIHKSYTGEHDYSRFQSVLLGNHDQITVIGNGYRNKRLNFKIANAWSEIKQCKFHPFSVVGHGSETQPEVDGNSNQIT